jgi:transposase
VIVQKAFKYRLFPTDDQAAQLAKTFGCARYVYNQALNYRSRAWLQEKKSLGYHDTALKLTAWKQETEKAFLSEFSLVVLQQSLRNLDTAFTNFFEMRAQYPKFKSGRHRQSARYATNAFTFRVRAAAAIRVWQCGTQYAGRAGNKAIRRFIVTQHYVGKRRQVFVAIAWRSLQCDEYAAI